MSIDVPSAKPTFESGQKVIVLDEQQEEQDGTIVKCLGSVWSLQGYKTYYRVETKNGIDDYEKHCIMEVE